MRVNRKREEGDCRDGKKRRRKEEEGRMVVLDDDDDSNRLQTVKMVLNDHLVRLRRLLNDGEGSMSEGDSEEGVEELRLECSSSRPVGRAKSFHDAFEFLDPRLDL